MTMSDSDFPNDPCAGSDPCRQAVAELYTYVDGELDDVTRATIAKHLDDCSPCLEAFEFHDELKTVVAQKCRESVPEELRARILAAITSDPCEAATPAG